MFRERTLNVCNMARKRFEDALFFESARRAEEDFVVMLS